LQACVYVASFAAGAVEEALGGVDDEEVPEPVAVAPFTYSSACKLTLAL